MKKRIVSLLLVCFLIGTMIVPAQAASASLTGNSTIKAGDSVVLTLNVSGKDFYGFSAALTYSDNLTLTGYKFLKWDDNKVVNGNVFTTFGMSAGKGDILSVTLKASSSAKVGDTFSASFKNIAISDGKGSEDTDLGTASWSGSVAAPPSTNCDLKAIECYNGTLVPAFNKDTTHYTVTVPYSVEQLSMDYFRADQGQSVTITGGTWKPTLVVGENTFVITVKAASGATKTYTLVATREQDPNYEPSKDASLKEMTVEGATLSPAFDPQITEYVAYIPFEQRELTLKGVPNDEKAVGVAEKKVELDKAENIPAFAPAVDQETGALLPVTTYLAEESVATLTCTAEDGITQQTYTVHVVRMPAYTGGVPHIHMTNEADLLAAEDEQIPEEDRPYEIPQTLELPLVGEMGTKTVLIAGGALAVVLMLLIGFLLGRIGRGGVVYEDDYEDDEPEDEPAAPVMAPAKVEEPAKTEKPAKSPKPAKKAKAFDYDEEDEFQRRLEEAVATEHKLPEKAPSAPAEMPKPVQQPQSQPRPQSAPAKAPAPKSAPTVDDDLSSMSLDDLLNDIKNM